MARSIWKSPASGDLPLRSRAGPTAQKAAKGTMAAASSRKAALHPKAGAMTPPSMYPAAYPTGMQR